MIKTEIYTFDRDYFDSDYWFRNIIFRGTRIGQSNESEAERESELTLGPRIFFQTVSRNFNRETQIYTYLYCKIWN